MPMSPWNNKMEIEHSQDETAARFSDLNPNPFDPVAALKIAYFDNITSNSNAATKRFNEAEKKSMRIINGYTGILSLL
jgi:hypothetical protein